LGADRFLGAEKVDGDDGAGGKADEEEEEEKDGDGEGEADGDQIRDEIGEIIFFLMEKNLKIISK